MGRGWERTGGSEDLEQRGSVDCDLLSGGRCSVGQSGEGEGEIVIEGGVDLDFKLGSYDGVLDI